MSLHRLTAYLLKHRWQALALTFVCTFIPVLGTLSILLAALVTLRKGVIEGAAFTLAAVLPYCISAYICSFYIIDAKMKTKARYLVDNIKLIFFK